MKKLKKLSINPEKVIKNEELINLRGGYGDDDEPTGYYCDFYGNINGTWRMVTVLSELRCGCGEAFQRAYPGSQWSDPLVDMQCFN